MQAGQPSEAEEPTGHTNQVEAEGGTGDVVQARDVHGGVHFHQQADSFAITPRQLPSPGHGFVNRGSELAYLGKVAVAGPDAPRVIIVTGTAGVGKTTLALRFAQSIRELFPDGQLYTNLRGYDPGLPATAGYVLGGFLRDLGVPARAIPAELDERAALFRSVVAGRRLLVVLDNAATVGQVRPLLPGEPGCLAIVTSRSTLSGLVAREGARRLQLDLLSEDEAIMLLREVTSGYRVGDDATDLAELARLCARLPLALRIAAERAASRPLMHLQDMIADLRNESGLWDALSTDGEEEAEAVRTVFAWSYRSLTESAARLFRLLGLHPGSQFDVSAAAALVGMPAGQVRSDVDALAQAHLVEQCGRRRYHLHDLLRAYAVDQVNQWETENARTDARGRVLSWYLHSADAVQRRVASLDHYPLEASPPDEIEPFDFSSDEDALSWFRAEAENLVAAVRQAAHAGRWADAWALAITARAIFMRENAFEDWITTARIAVEAATQLSDRSKEAEAYENLGKALFQYGTLDEAEIWHQHALQARREEADRFGEAVSVNALGLLALRRRHLDDAASYFESGARIFADLGERTWAALLRGNLAESLCESGDFETAAGILDEVLRTIREQGDAFYEGNTLFLLAWAHRGMGHLEQARTAIDTALRIAADQGNDMARAHWLTELARIQLARRDTGEALTSSQQAAAIQRRLGDRSREAAAIDLTGQAYQQLDRHADAAKFHRHAANVHRDLNNRWHLAITLDHLSTALEHPDEPAEAERCRREAITQLDQFTDPLALALRERLRQGLGNQ